MKKKSLSATLGFLGAASLFAATPLIAGEMVAGKNPPPLPPAPEISNLLDPIETTLSVGYDSSYMFRGFNYGEEAVWAGLDFSVPLAFPIGDVTLNAGAWYINPTEGVQNFPAAPSRGATDDEIDLYAGLSTTVGPVDVALGYVHYDYPESVLSGDSNEVNLALGFTAWLLDVTLLYAHDFDLGDLGPSGAAAGFGPVQPYHALSHYWEAALGSAFDLTDRLGLALGVSAGWYSTDFSHLEYRLSLPLQVAENVVLEPYVAYVDDRSSGTLRAVRQATNPNGTGANQQDDFFTGVSLSVTF